MKCPSCGSDRETGNFCSQCGAALTADCPSCGAESEPGDSFCTACGESLTGGSPTGGGRGRSRAPWYIAGAAILVTVLVLALPDDTERAGPPGMTGGAGAPGATGSAGGAPPISADGLLSSDMRTNADRLFNRVMTAAEQGDQAQVDQFMPMAVQAYGMVDDLDDDGLYHLAILHLTSGQYDQARATAQRVLDQNPDHILLLGVAAQAAAAAGDDEEARWLYRHLLDVYGQEAARPLAEYVDHNPMLSQYRTEAREYLGEG